MAFKSKSQMRRYEMLVKSGMMDQEVFDRHMAETPHMEKLPERYAPSKSTVKPVRGIKPGLRGRK